MYGRNPRVINPLATMADGIVQRQQQDKELQTLERMNARIDRDRQMDARAAQEEKLYYDQIREESKNLLPADRKKIAERAKQIRSKSRELLEIYGGDKSKFMNNGGREMLNNYQDELLSSEEMIDFQENSKNLERILDAQRRGLGHLINRKDLRNLRNYDPEKGGNITYGGLLQEIEIDELRQNFNYDEQITYSAILNHKGNRALIESNFMMTYPDEGEGPNGRPTEGQIRSFMYEMGYGGLGTDRTMQKEELLRERAQAKAANKKAKEIGKDGKRLFTTDYAQYLNSFKRAYPEGVNASNWREKYNGNFTGSVIETSGAGKGLVKKERDWTVYGTGYDYNKPGMFDINNPTYAWGNDYQLTEGRKMFSGGEADIAKAVFGENQMIEGGYLKNFSVSRDTFDSTGNRLDPDMDETTEGGDFYGNYKIEGISQAYFVKDMNGNKKIVTDLIHPDSHEIVKEEDQRWKDDQYKTNEWETGAVIALRDNDGKLFYQEVDLKENRAVRNAINNLYEGNDYTETIESEQASEERRYEIQVKNNKEAAELKQNIAVGNQIIENNPRFATINRDYSQPGTDGNINRSDLIKTAHLAMYQNYKETSPDSEVTPEEFMTFALDQNVFTNNVLVEDDIIDMVGNQSYQQNMSDQDVISEWFKMTTRGLDKNSEDYIEAQRMRDKWLQLMTF